MTRKRTNVICTAIALESTFFTSDLLLLWSLTRISFSFLAFVRPRFNSDIQVLFEIVYALGSHFDLALVLFPFFYSSFCFWSVFLLCENWFKAKPSCSLVVVAHCFRLQWFMRVVWFEWCFCLWRLKQMVGLWRVKEEKSVKFFLMICCMRRRNV